MRIGREHTECPVCGKYLVLNGSVFRTHVRGDRRLASGKGMRCPASGSIVALASGIAAAERRAATRPKSADSVRSRRPRDRLALTIIHGTPFQFDVVATDSGGNVVGRVEANRLVDGGVESFCIGNCDVERIHRRRGIGKAMVREALSEGIRRYGAKTAYIDVVPHNGSSQEDVDAFWAELGFVRERGDVAFGFRGRLMSKILQDP